MNAYQTLQLVSDSLNILCAADSIKPQDMIDRRYLVDLEKSGVFDK